ncbi:hypothetical protein BV22DRAFT_532757 [Leucogyrophana mollusca]|uniref:Uncharacterized protein n=1 Tax=Leucogyrophana mollusca TaxID=85980 RepID=A0ACB8BEN7_9AGAM|nr:hypothetical protein BV22DRAFT_532757 [Leucogyrophana mollusca]
MREPGIPRGRPVLVPPHRLQEQLVLRHQRLVHPARHAHRQAHILEVLVPPAPLQQQHLVLRLVRFSGELDDGRPLDGAPCGEGRVRPDDGAGARAARGTGEGAPGPGDGGRERRRRGGARVVGGADGAGAAAPGGFAGGAGALGLLGGDVGGAVERPCASGEEGWEGCFVGGPVGTVFVRVGAVGFCGERGLGHGKAA